MTSLDRAAQHSAELHHLADSIHVQGRDHFDDAQWTAAMAVHHPLVDAAEADGHDLQDIGDAAARIYQGGVA